MLQSEMAEKLQKRKVEHIESMQPQVVAAGTISCMERIGRATVAPIVYTVQLLDWATGGLRPANLQTV